MTLKDLSAPALALASALALSSVVACAGAKEELKPMTEAAQAAAAQAKADAGKTVEQLKAEARAQILEMTGQTGP